MTRLFVALIMPCILASCWDGGIWYAPSASGAPITAGMYRVVEPGRPADNDERLFINRNKDGSLTLTVDTSWRIVTVPFGPAEEKRYIVQAQRVDGEQRDDHALLFLLELRDNRSFITLPPCGGATREAVEQSGGTILRDPNSAPGCRFATQKTFERQLTAFIASPDRKGPDLELVRIGK